MHRYWNYTLRASLLISNSSNIFVVVFIPPEKHPLAFGVITVQNAPWKKLVKRGKFIENARFDSLWVAMSLELK